jgi:simple sugar transport system permease protein
VTALRYQALIITAVLVGIGGAYLSIAQSAGFNNNMSAGRGYIALAALIFAKWKPWPALLVCLMFGFLDAVQLRVQGLQFPIIGEVPVQFIQMLPYILTIVLLAGFIGRAVAPKASGIPYTKER